MIRLPSSSPEEHFGLALLAQFLFVCVLVVATIALLATLVSSSARSSPSMFFRTSLTQVGKWVDQTGKSTVLRGVVAEALGFPNVDIRVRERGFKNSDERFTHVCSTTDLLGFEEIIFLASVDETTGDALVWRGTRQGDLTSTAQFAGGFAKAIPNEVHQTAFIAEKHYFIKQMQTQAFRTGPALHDAPAPPKEATPKPLPEAWRNTALPAEIDVLLLNPVVLPVIVTILALGVHRASRRP